MGFIGINIKLNKAKVIKIYSLLDQANETL